VRDDDDGPPDGRPAGDGAVWAGDVVVPDDLRELGHDVEAYRRELRAARRRDRLRHWVGARPGTRWPAAGSLIAMLLLGVGLVAGLLFALPVHQVALRRPAPLADPAIPAGQLGGLLPEVTLRLPEAARALTLRPALFALVPARCGCAAILDSLAGQAAQYDIPLVVVAAGGFDPELAGLVQGIHVGNAEAAYDPSGVLAATYRADQVTAVILAPDGTVPYVLRDATSDTAADTATIGGHLDASMH